jgi:ribosomal protein S18 acetylase RimI-like enzyme
MFTVTDAFKTDIPLIRELCLQVWPQTYAPILSKEQIDYMLEMMYSETSLKQQMQEGSQFILIHENDEPVGFASFQETAPGVYKLHKIYVLPSQQGKGTGRFMLDNIISRIKKKGAKALQLQVNRYNKAKSFYEKLGFVVVKEADFDIGNGYFMNDYVMEKKL